MPNIPSPNSTSFLDSITLKKQHYIALFLLFIVPFFMFSATTFGGKKILGSDTVQYSAAVKSVNDYRVAHPGKEAIWAPNMFSGMPAYVITKPRTVPNIDNLLHKASTILYPVNFFWVLLGGAYLFFILLKIKPIPAATGAVFIAFTTYIPVIIEAGHVTKFHSYAFIPWILVGYLLLTTSKRKILGFFVFALALTLEARANHPQVLYYFMYVLAIWWAFDTFKAYKVKELKPWLVTTLLIGLAGLLAILTNIENYWILYEYSQHSTRGGSALESAGSRGLSLDYAFAWSQDWGELFTLLVPGLFGGSSGEAYWGPKPFTSGPHYMGAITFLLALFGIIKSKNRLKYVFLSVGTLTALFSLGNFFPLLNETMFKFMPLFNKFRTPEMWLIVTVVSFSILAVLGFSELLELAKKKGGKIKDIALPLGIAVALAFIFMLGSTTFLSFEKPGEIEAIAQQNNVSAQNPQVRNQIKQLIETRVKPARIEIAKADSIRFAALILIGCGLIFAFYTGRLRKEFFLAGIFILGTYDMISIGNRYLNKDRFIAQATDANAIIQSQKRPLDTYIINNIQSDEGYPYRVLPLLDNPFNNAVPTYFYPSLGGYTAAKLSYYQDLVDQLLFSGPYGINAPVLNMLNAKFVSTNQEAPLPFLKKVFEDNNTFVYENTEVLPKAFFADTLIQAASPKDAISVFHSLGDFNPQEVSIVETWKTLSTSHDSTASVAVIQYDVQHIMLKSSSQKPQFLVLSEIYYPEGWSAIIDGNPTEIYKTNYVLRGIEVLAGVHNFDFVFNPVSVTLGHKLSWAGTLFVYGIGIFAIVGFYRERKESEDDIFKAV